MSRLKLYCPEELQDNDLLQFTRFDAEHDHDEMIIPLRMRQLPTGNDSMLDVLLRAQQIRANRACPDCGHPAVSPVELNDAQHNRNGMPIPGSATLVGFHCSCCDAEWPV